MTKRNPCFLCLARPKLWVEGVEGNSKIMSAFLRGGRGRENKTEKPLNPIIRECLNCKFQVSVILGHRLIPRHTNILMDTEAYLV